MNDRSSRAHTIVTVKLQQNFPNNVSKLASVNLVDLAGRSVLPLLSVVCYID